MTSTVVSGKTVNSCIRQALDQLKARRDQVDIEIIEEARKGFLGIGAKDAVVKVSLREDVVDKKDEDFVKSILYSNTDKNLEEIKEDAQEISDDFDNADDEISEELILDREDFSNDSLNLEKDLEDDNPSDENPVKEVSDENLIDEEKESSNDSPDKSFEISKDSDIYISAKEILNKIIEDMHIKAYAESRVEGRTIKFNMICEDQSDIGILIGKRGETLDSLQFLVNLVANRNSTTHVRVILDINDYRSKREKSLQKLARNLAAKAKKTNREVKLEPMNAYERKIIHTELQNDKEVYTFSQGDEPHRRVVIRKK